MANDTFDAMMAGAVMTCVGAGLFVKGFKRLRTLRRIENMPTSKVRSMPMGSVELCGVARLDPPLAAPFSEIPSVYWEVEVEKYVRSGKKSHWQVIHRESSETPFYLGDGTGEALVWPKGAEGHLPTDLCTQTMSPAISRFLFERGISHSTKMRFTERQICSGQKAYVLGVAQERPDLWRTHIDALNTRLREIKENPEALAALDTTGDGKIDDLEWEVARRAVRDELAAEEVADRVVVGRGEKGEMFVLSDRSEKDLVGRLRWAAAGSVVGGGALFIGGALWLLNGVKNVGWSV